MLHAFTTGPTHVQIEWNMNISQLQNYSQTNSVIIMTMLLINDEFWKVNQYMEKNNKQKQKINALT